MLETSRRRPWGPRRQSILFSDAPPPITSRNHCLQFDQTNCKQFYSFSSSYLSSRTGMRRRRVRGRATAACMIVIAVVVRSITMTTKTQLPGPGYNNGVAVVYNFRCLIEVWL